MTTDPWRVAQIVAERGSAHESSRGSGYLIAPGRVLTAAHVVAGASLIRVRLDVGQEAEIDVHADNWWADPAGHGGTDLAVIAIPKTATEGRACEPAGFGRIGDSAAVLSVTAFGFPLFKLRHTVTDVGPQTVFRDFEQASGHTPVAANRRQGTLAVYLDDPPPHQPPQGEPSPWAGMSGGPVLVGDRIVGVVAEHHPSEGTGRLTARRIDRAYYMLSASDLGGLVERLGLPLAVSGLPDLVPYEQGQLVRSAYLAQVFDIVPDRLIGRDDELTDWAEFCSGADPYTWWQAGPWAGKSALASWFVLHPPAGVDVVSFFITGRLSGQADSDAFLDAMIEQLHSLNPATGSSPVATRARAGAWWDLLALAAAEAEERGRRLVVVVDGLDEDEVGATPVRGQCSIASLLPRRPPSGVRFIVTSRPDPGLPDDLSSDHPLRTCGRRHLPVSRLAADIELRSKQELRHLLAGDQIAVDVVGYVAGSGGGLNRNDLSALIEVPPHKIEPVLRGVFGRSLYTRAATDPRNPQADPAIRVYLFAHETLRATAEEQLGRELARYRRKINEWIEFYANSGWPDITPGYAIRSYPRLLAATADITRLCALARDPHRHAFLLHSTGNDYAALTEIRTAQNMIAAASNVDLKALVELAAYRLAVFLRNQSIPDDLPGMWAKLGRFDHAEALARTIADPDDQAWALTDVATTIAGSGDVDRAEALARTITRPDRQADALSDLASAIAEAGDLDRAEVLARTIPDPDLQADALTELVSAVAEAGNLDRAEVLARTIPDPHRQADALTRLVAAIAEAGDVDGARRLAADAETVARAIPDRDLQADALTRLVAAIGRAGDLEGARRLAADAEVLARAIPDPDRQVRAIAGLVSAVAEAGDLDRAEVLARTIARPDRQADALAGLVAAIGKAGDLDRAEVLARTIARPDRQADAVVGLVAAVAKAGDLARARRLAADAELLARAIPDPDRQGYALSALVAAVAESGDLDRAEVLARAIPDPDRQGYALSRLVSVVATAGDLDRAEVLARAIMRPDRQADALTELVSVIVEAGDLDRARQLAADAETVARTTINPDDQAEMQALLVEVAASAGDLDRAEALARAIMRPDPQAGALTGLVSVLAEAGDVDGARRLAADAETVARAIPDPDRQADALTSLVAVVAKAGDVDGARRLAADAETVARAIPDPERRAYALTGLITAIGKAGDLDRAEALARAIPDPEQGWALTELASAIAEAGDLDRAEALARTIPDHDQQEWALTGLVSAVAEAGDLDRAEALARAISDPDRQADALTTLVAAIGKARNLGLAHRLAADAEALARAIPDPDRQGHALTGLVAAIGMTGDLDRAEVLARTVTRPDRQADALARLVSAVAEAGDLDRAEVLARAIADPDRQADALTGLVAAAIEAGDLDRAEVLARAIADPDRQAEAFNDLADAIAQAGDLRGAARLLAKVLVVEVLDVFWLKTISKFFPSAIGEGWDIISGPREQESDAQ